MPFTIRPVVPEDTPALSRICLLTGDAGQSAESLHRHCELPGLVWALPYVSLPSETARTWGFVLVDDAASDDDHKTNSPRAGCGTRGVPGCEPRAFARQSAAGGPEARLGTETNRTRCGAFA